MCSQRNAQVTQRGLPISATELQHGRHHMHSGFCVTSHPTEAALLLSALPQSPGLHVRSPGLGHRSRLRTHTDFWVSLWANYSSPALYKVLAAPKPNHWLSLSKLLLAPPHFSTIRKVSWTQEPGHASALSHVFLFAQEPQSYSAYYLRPENSYLIHSVWF